MAKAYYIYTNKKGENMGNSEVKGWYELQCNFNLVNNMEYKPSFKRLRKNQIIDKDKSLKWNQEQVEINNERYKKEAVKLNKERHKAWDSFNKDICTKIQAEIGYGISEEAAMKIWRYAYEYEQLHNCNDIQCVLDRIIELVSEALKSCAKSN